MAKKDYQAYQATINAFREFVSHQGWSIAQEKEVDYGYQIVVFDGLTKNPVVFYPSGKILVQGKPGNLIHLSSCRIRAKDGAISDPIRQSIAEGSY